MNTFSPGLERTAADGTRVERQPYPTGAGGTRLSIDKIAKRIYEGSADKDVQGWAYDQLRAVGVNGRSGNTSAMLRAQTLLDAWRAVTIYTPDPPGMEMMKSAAAMLCLRPGLCIRGGDCDDNIIGLGSTLASVGIPVQIVKQFYGDGIQEHVLLAVQDDQGKWHRVDPSTNLPIGQAPTALKEDWVNPLDPQISGVSANYAGEFVGIGRPARRRHVVKKDGIWWEYQNGQWYRFVDGSWRQVGTGKQTLGPRGRKGGQAVGAGAPAGVGFICMASDIVNGVRDLNTTIESVNNDLKACKTLSTDDPQYQSWLQFRNDWFRWSSTVQPSDFDVPCYTNLQELQRYQKEAYDWQNKLKAICTLSKPIEQPPVYQTIDTTDTSKKADSFAKVIAALGVLAAVGGGIYLLTIFGPAIRQGIDAAVHSRPRAQRSKRYDDK